MPLFSKKKKTDVDTANDKAVSKRTKEKGSKKPKIKRHINSMKMNAVAEDAFVGVLHYAIESDNCPSVINDNNITYMLAFNDELLDKSDIVKSDQLAQFKKCFDYSNKTLDLTKDNPFEEGSITNGTFASNLNASTAKLNNDLVVMLPTEATLTSLQAFDRSIDQSQEYLITTLPSDLTIDNIDSYESDGDVNQINDILTDGDGNPITMTLKQFQEFIVKRKSNSSVADDTVDYVAELLSESDDLSIETEEDDLITDISTDSEDVSDLDENPLTGSDATDLLGSTDDRLGDGLSLADDLLGDDLTLGDTDQLASLADDTLGASLDNDLLSNPLESLGSDSLETLSMDLTADTSSELDEDGLSIGLNPLDVLSDLDSDMSTDSTSNSLDDDLSVSSSDPLSSLDVDTTPLSTEESPVNPLDTLDELIPDLTTQATEQLSALDNSTLDEVSSPQDVNTSFGFDDATTAVSDNEVHVPSIETSDSNVNEIDIESQVADQQRQLEPLAFETEQFTEIVPFDKIRPETEIIHETIERAVSEVENAFASVRKPHFKIQATDDQNSELVIQKKIFNDVFDEDYERSKRSIQASIQHDIELALSEYTDEDTFKKTHADVYNDVFNNYLSDELLAEKTDEMVRNVQEQYNADMEVFIRDAIRQAKLQFDASNGPIRDEIIADAPSIVKSKQEDMFRNKLTDVMLEQQESDTDIISDKVSSILQQIPEKVETFKTVLDNRTEAASSELISIARQETIAKRYHKRVQQEQPQPVVQAPIVQAPVVQQVPVPTPTSNVSDEKVAELRLELEQERKQSLQLQQQMIELLAEIKKGQQAPNLQQTPVQPTTSSSEDDLEETRRVPVIDESVQSSQQSLKRSESVEPNVEKRGFFSKLFKRR